MIDGVKVTPLRALPDERGRLMEMFRSDEPDFEKGAIEAIKGIKKKK